ncbi:hypothetical protein HYY75_06900 [bacterium]|nr:hypothetical protein [bacterium]
MKKSFCVFWVFVQFSFLSANVCWSAKPHKGKRTGPVFPALEKIVDSFSTLDLNKDGIVDVVEQGPIKNRKHIELVKSIDADGDSKITKIEVRRKIFSTVLTRTEGLFSKIKETITNDSANVIPKNDLSQKLDPYLAKKAIELCNPNNAGNLSDEEKGKIEPIVFVNAIRKNLEILNAFVNSPPPVTERNSQQRLIFFTMDENENNNIEPTEFDAFLKKALGEAVSPIAIDFLKRPKKETVISSRPQKVKVETSSPQVKTQNLPPVKTTSPSNLNYIVAAQNQSPEQESPNLGEGLLNDGNEENILW